LNTWLSFGSAQPSKVAQLSVGANNSPQSWSVDVASLNTATYDLSVKNPNGGDEVALRTPQEILDEIAALDAESAEVLATIRGLVV
jgi:type I restriction enzyme M protein